LGLKPDTIGTFIALLSGMSISNDHSISRQSVDNPDLSSNIGKTLDGRTATINQQLSTNIAEKSSGIKAFFANVASGGKRNVALRKIQNFISSEANDNTHPPLDPKYEKYLPKSTLSLYKELKVAIADNNTLKSLWDSRSPDPLGEGSFGKVYSSADGKFIFKVMKPTEGFNPIEPEINANKVLMSGVQTMQQSSEAFYTQGVDFVTQYKGAFTLEGQDVLVFERAQGKEMYGFLENHSIRNSQDITTHARMGAELANGIAMTHAAGLVHRDIKPENTMVHVAADGAVTAKVIDQGLACRNADQEALSQLAGTPMYMAPELLSDGSRRSSAMDVYSLGIVLVNNFFHEGQIDRFIENAFCQEIMGSSDEFSQCDQDIRRDYPGFSLASFNRQNFFEKILANPEQYSELFDSNDTYSNDQFKFLCGLIRDCVNPDQTARPTAAQVGYCLEFFAACMDDNARIEAHNAQPENLDHPLEKVTIPSYQDIIALAKADRPAKQDQPALQST
jgi:serine/threonine protein kinase